jgi:hypothetical protein
VPHPDREDVWTLGECIPIPVDDGDPRNLQSRVVLYFGSFQALARDADDFDWTEEAWETLTHEIRHHVEWKARVPDLEALDRAAEANYARQDAQPFDPAFYRDGISLSDGRYQVDDDVFVEAPPRGAGFPMKLRWQGADYDIPVPGEAELPAFLTVEGVDEPPSWRSGAGTPAQGRVAPALSEAQGLSRGGGGEAGARVGFQRSTLMNCRKRTAE